MTKHGNRVGMMEAADRFSAELMAIPDRSGRINSSIKDEIKRAVARMLDIVTTSCDNLYAQ